MIISSREEFGFISVEFKRDSCNEFIIWFPLENVVMTLVYCLKTEAGYKLYPSAMMKLSFLWYRKEHGSSREIIL